VFNKCYSSPVRGAALKAVFLLHSEGSIPLDLSLDQHRFARFQLHPLAYNNRIFARLSLGRVRRDARDVRSKTSSRSLGLGWVRDTGSERALFGNSASGGWLGGWRETWSVPPPNTAAFSATKFSPRGCMGISHNIQRAGSYRGAMPFYARLFSGDELVRGFVPGNSARMRQQPGSQRTARRPIPLTFGSKSRWRGQRPNTAFLSLAGRKAAAFFDLGCGLLLPRWLGPPNQSYWARRTACFTAPRESSSAGPARRPGSRSRLLRP